MTFGWALDLEITILYVNYVCHVELLEIIYCGHSARARAIVFVWVTSSAQGPLVGKAQIQERLESKRVGTILY